MSITLNATRMVGRIITGGCGHQHYTSGRSHLVGGCCHHSGGLDLVETLMVGGDDMCTGLDVVHLVMVMVNSVI